MKTSLVVVSVVLPRVILAVPEAVVLNKSSTSVAVPCSSEVRVAVAAVFSETSLLPRSSTMARCAVVVVEAIAKGMESRLAVLS